MQPYAAAHVVVGAVVAVVGVAAHLQLDRTTMTGRVN
jgi:hypothetical protein